MRDLQCVLMHIRNEKALIITVAGTASRFNKDLDKETLKCLYFEGKPENSLLCQIIKTLVILTNML